ncbi:5'-nucleotidase C-terminal domain-containing protein [Rhizosphaericola mali]|uniref:5'-Nucleotidase C-terminal domain-containing protein n=1 Tax=Rhizosphaericola mali TaxID=2545455 RepID=A0A5P2G3J1_9BACT|nr:5'-nucleotidase C-terminal domain-containing protein [Rhizosphaericola mali]QES89298.1 hypothetical protein E0W69_011700 [Rhizosphaericola mali]
MYDLFAQKIVPKKKIDSHDLNDTIRIKPIGFSNRIFKNQFPSGELGNLIADAVKNEIEISLKKRLDFVYIPRTAIRSNLPKGNVGVEDIDNILPFNDSLAIIEVLGTDLNKLMNVIAQKGGGAISGGHFKIKSMHAEDIDVDGDSIHLNNQYSIATLLRNVKGRENCSMLIAYPYKIFEITLTSLLIKYIEKITYDSRPISPSYEHRISYKND